MPIRRVSPIILRINTKILAYSRFLNPGDNLNLYYDAIIYTKYFRLLYQEVTKCQITAIASVQKPGFLENSEIDSKVIV